MGVRHYFKEAKGLPHIKNLRTTGLEQWDLWGVSQLVGDVPLVGNGDVAL